MLCIQFLICYNKHYQIQLVPLTGSAASIRTGNKTLFVLETEPVVLIQLIDQEDSLHLVAIKTSDFM
jgi:hypothetical protein